MGGCAGRAADPGGYAGPMRSVLKDFSPSTLVAGFVAVLVGYTSSVAIIFQATVALGASPAQIFIGSFIASGVVFINAIALQFFFIATGHQV